MVLSAIKSVPFRRLVLIRLCCGFSGPSCASELEGTSRSSSGHPGPITPDQRGGDRQGIDRIKFSCGVPGWAGSHPGLNT